MERIEFAKLLNFREFTHLLLGHRNNSVFVGFSAVLVLAAAIVWGIFWIPDPLRPGDIVDNGDSFGLDCNSLPSDLNNGAQLCNSADKSLGFYLGEFRQRKPFTVDFDVNARTAKGEPDIDQEAFFKDYICPVKKSGALANMTRGHQRFLYFLLAHNEGKLCADKMTGAKSRLVRSAHLSGGAINFVGFLSQTICLLFAAACAGIIIMTWFTRRAYLWLYGSYHVRSME